MLVKESSLIFDELAKEYSSNYRERSTILASIIENHKDDLEK
jgi:hypothetical protein